MCPMINNNKASHSGTRVFFFTFLSPFYFFLQMSTAAYTIRTYVKFHNALIRRLLRSLGQWFSAWTMLLTCGLTDAYNNKSVGETTPSTTERYDIGRVLCENRTFFSISLVMLRLTRRRGKPRTSDIQIIIIL